ncbi:glutathione synthase [Panus rudis PR-1116 ss-1]|nr:glutathione synthase [Panus rudis PR-1116 ss-1]
MAQQPFPEWPPSVTTAQLNTLTLLATTYALSHGLVYLPPTTPTSPPPPAPRSTIHAPLSLFPSPIPRYLFTFARHLQSAYNVLYARIAMDVEFLDEVMGEEKGVGKADSFTGNLWRRWKRVRDEGPRSQPLQLGLFRSDYMIHAPQDGKSLSLKQVEFNTISSSFGTLSERSAALHRYLAASTGFYGSSPYLSPENFPENKTTSGLAEGLAEAHKAYGVPSARILFVVQPGERNVFDQRWLEYELLERHSIHVVRQTFDELLTSLSLDPSTNALHITLDPSLLPKNNNSSVEISVVYFRAGYTPTDYPTSAHYDVRYLLEKSRAINCPSIPLQLAGGKKVQEVLTKPGILERFLKGQQGIVGDTDKVLEEIRSTWMEMWSLDQESTPTTASSSTDTESSVSGLEKALQEHMTLVLKPQREGGGNNVYKDSIPSFLETLPPSERQAWIAMKLIETPQGLGNYLVRAGGGGSAGTSEGAVKTEVISELGIFGWALFGDGDVKGEKEAGWLVRTKGKESNEGGVAAGFSVLDSIVLVD